jgi:hypothetical protein
MRTLVAVGVVSVLLGAGVGPAAAQVEPRELLPVPAVRSYPMPLVQERGPRPVPIPRVHAAGRPVPMPHVADPGLGPLQLHAAPRLGRPGRPDRLAPRLVVPSPR